MRLAIVDDDDDVRTALARLLRSMNNEVVVFASAEDFEAKAVAVDCAIVDVSLRGISGLELAERLHNRRPPTPVVLITGDGDRLTRESARVGGTPLIVKPFDSAALAEAITQAVSNEGAFRQDHAH
jgi:FixJ family two-component response regulator